MPFEPLEEKRRYVRAESLGDRIWDVIGGWDWFAKKTIGMQLTRAADSIGANVAEAGGRFHPADVRNFLYFARGSLRETKYWLRRCRQRQLIADDVFAELDAELEQLSQELNASISFQRSRTVPK